eukprot:6700706-Prymnesium_polylepis.1
MHLSQVVAREFALISGRVAPSSSSAAFVDDDPDDPELAGAVKKVSKQPSATETKPIVVGDRYRAYDGTVGRVENNGGKAWYRLKLLDHTLSIKSYKARDLTPARFEPAYELEHDVRPAPRTLIGARVEVWWEVEEEVEVAKQPKAPAAATSKKAVAPPPTEEQAQLAKWYQGVLLPPETRHTPGWFTIKYDLGGSDDTEQVFIGIRLDADDSPYLAYREDGELLEGFGAQPEFRIVEEARVTGAIAEARRQLARDQEEGGRCGHERRGWRGGRRAACSARAGQGHAGNPGATSATAARGSRREGENGSQPQVAAARCRSDARGAQEGAEDARLVGGDGDGRGRRLARRWRRGAGAAAAAWPRCGANTAVAGTTRHAGAARAWGDDHRACHRAYARGGASARGRPGSLSGTDRVAPADASWRYAGRHLTGRSGLCLDARTGQVWAIPSQDCGAPAGPAIICSCAPRDADVEAAK